MQNKQPQQRSPLRVFWLAVLAAFAAAIGLRGLMGGGTQQGGPGADTHAAVGRPLPDLYLQGLGDAPATVQLEQLRGKVVLLNFWGTWCGYCVQELPHIAELAEQLGDRDDFRVLAISYGQSQREDIYQLETTTLEFLESRKLQLPVYADLDRTTMRAVDMALGGFGGFPTTLLLDRSGAIRAVWVGAGGENEMQRLSQQLLDEPA